MIENFTHWLFGKFGYEPRREPGMAAGEPLFSLTQYLDQDGVFDYEAYRLTQEEGNKRKLSWVWVKQENIEFLSKYIRSNLDSPHIGICHGTRRGKEQEWFRDYLNCEVIGTDISETATEFPDTIQWDFHDVKPEWLGSIDFIYSNSFDHSYDPEKCLNAWMSCLKEGGLCIIEHSSLDGPECIDELDAFGAELTVMPYLITLWANGRYFVRQILDAPRKTANLSFLKFIVIQKAGNAVEEANGNRT